MNQSKFNVPTFDLASPLSDDIVCVVPPKHVEIPKLELYNGKGDPLTHVKTLQILCSGFFIIKYFWLNCLLEILGINLCNGFVICHKY